MKIFVKLFCLVTAMSFIIISSASAGDQDRIRDKKKDGSCQPIIELPKDVLQTAGDRTRDRKRDKKKDGSCQS